MKVEFLLIQKPLLLKKFQLLKNEFQPIIDSYGGPNGAGKTTLSNYLIQRGRINENITPIINPDLIALTLNEENQTKKRIPGSSFGACTT